LISLGSLLPDWNFMVGCCCCSLAILAIWIWLRNCG